MSQILNFEDLELHFCQRVEKTPGIQSSEISLFTPYIYLSVIAFGFIFMIRYVSLPGTSDSTYVRILRMVVFPVIESPSNIKPCRTSDVS